MGKSLTDEILHVCKILNKNAVQYLIVGGTAVVFTDILGGLKIHPELVQKNLTLTSGTTQRMKITLIF